MNAGSAIAELFSAIIPGDFARKPVAMVVAYLDDSGSHAGAPCTLVAGFVGDAAAWIEFEKEWATILAEFSIPYSHAKKMAHFSGHYASWTPATRQKFMSRVAAALKRHSMAGIAGVVSQADHRAVFGNTDAAGPMDSAHGISFRMCMLKCSEYARVTGETLSFVIEDGHKNKVDVMRIFDLTKASRRTQALYPMGSIAFADKKAFGALQAADVLAYNVYRNIEAIKGRVPVHDDFSTLIEQFPMVKVNVIDLPMLVDLRLSRETLIAEYKRRRKRK